jgi:pentatricopeptide repeat protein
MTSRHRYRRPRGRPTIHGMVLLMLSIFAIVPSVRPFIRLPRLRQSMVYQLLSSSSSSSSPPPALSHEDDEQGYLPRGRKVARHEHPRHRSNPSDKNVVNHNAHRRSYKERRKTPQTFASTHNHDSERPTRYLGKQESDIRSLSDNDSGFALTPSSPAAIQFNKWLARSLREGSITVEQAETELLQRLETYNRFDTQNDTNSTDLPTRIRNYDSISFNVILNAWARERSLKAARRADALLELLHKQETPHQNATSWIGGDANTITLQADTYSYSAVLNAYAKSGGKRAAALRAEELLQQMEVRLGAKQLASTDICHNAVMDCWSVSGELDAGRRAQVWLRRLQDPASHHGHHPGGAGGPQPTRISYNACLKAWARSKPPQGAIQAHAILEQMKQIGGDVAPDKISYSTCIDAYCRAGSAGNWTWAATQAEALLREMEDLASTCARTTATPETQQRPPETKQYHDNGHSSLLPQPPANSVTSSVRPDVVAYTSVLCAYAKAGMEYSQAMDLISRMERFSGQKPNTTFLNTLMHLFAKTGMVQHAEALLQRMKQSQRADKISYTMAISAHAHARVVNVQRATELLEELEATYRTTSEERYLPSAKTYASVMNAMSKSKPSTTTTMHKDKGETLNVLEQVDNLLHRMETLYQQTHDPDLNINTVVYSQVFQILSNNSRQHSNAAARRAIKLLEEMKQQQETNPQVQPDASTYAYFVNTLTKSRIPNAAQLATEVLQTVERGYDAGDDGLKPTKLLYSAVLQAYAKSASRHGAELAEQLLQRTQYLYQTKGKLYAKPNTLYYNAVMDAHARSRGGLEAALRAEALLMELETKYRARDDPELAPTTRSFNAVLLAWKNANTADAPQRAEALLKRMNERYKRGDANCRPDRVTINSIIGVWAKSSDGAAPARAEVFLRFMEQLYHEAGDMSLKPDRYSFNSVIDAYARQQQQQSATANADAAATNPAPSNTTKTDAVNCAEHLFQRMMTLYKAGDKEMCPDVITLTSLRTAWAHCNHVEAPQRIRELNLMIADMRRQNQRRITVLSPATVYNINTTITGTRNTTSVGR